MLFFLSSLDLREATGGVSSSRRLFMCTDVSSVLLESIFCLGICLFYRLALISLPLPGGWALGLEKGSTRVCHPLGGPQAPQPRGKRGGCVGLWLREVQDSVFSSSEVGFPQEQGSGTRSATCTHCSSSDGVMSVCSIFNIFTPSSTPSNPEPPVLLGEPRHLRGGCVSGLNVGILGGVLGEWV